MPNNRCAVPFCHRRGGYTFPKDVAIRKQWERAVRRKGHGQNRWVSSNYSVVCSCHFAPSDYENPARTACGSIRLQHRLKKGVVPSIFPWTKTKCPPCPEAASWITVDSTNSEKSVFCRRSNRTRVTPKRLLYNPDDSAKNKTKNENKNATPLISQNHQFQANTHLNAVDHHSENNYGHNFNFRKRPVPVSLTCVSSSEIYQATGERNNDNLMSKNPANPYNLSELGMDRNSSTLVAKLDKDDPLVTTLKNDTHSNSNGHVKTQELVLTKSPIFLKPTKPLDMDDISRKPIKLLILDTGSINTKTASTISRLTNHKTKSDETCTPDIKIKSATYSLLPPSHSIVSCTNSTSYSSQNIDSKKNTILSSPHQRCSFPIVSLNHPSKAVTTTTITTTTNVISANAEFSQNCNKSTNMLMLKRQKNPKDIQSKHLRPPTPPLNPIAIVLKQKSGSVSVNQNILEQSKSMSFHTPRSDDLMSKPKYKVKNDCNIQLEASYKSKQDTTSSLAVDGNLDSVANSTSYSACNIDSKIAMSLSLLQSTIPNVVLNNLSKAGTIKPHCYKYILPKPTNSKGVKLSCLDKQKPDSVNQNVLGKKKENTHCFKASPNYNKSSVVGKLESIALSTDSTSCSSHNTDSEITVSNHSLPSGSIPCVSLNHPSKADTTNSTNTVFSPYSTNVSQKLRDPTSILHCLLTTIPLNPITTVQEQKLDSDSVNQNILGKKFKTSGSDNKIKIGSDFNIQFEASDKPKLDKIPSSTVDGNDSKITMLPHSVQSCSIPNVELNHLSKSIANSAKTHCNKSNKPTNPKVVHSLPTTPSLNPSTIVRRQKLDSGNGNQKISSPSPLHEDLDTTALCTNNSSTYQSDDTINHPILPDDPLSAIKIEIDLADECNYIPDNSIPTSDAGDPTSQCQLIDTETGDNQSWNRYPSQDINLSSKIEFNPLTSSKHFQPRIIQSSIHSLTYTAPEELNANNFDFDKIDVPSQPRALGCVCKMMIKDESNPNVCSLCGQEVLHKLIESSTHDDLNLKEVKVEENVTNF